VQIDAPQKNQEVQKNAWLFTLRKVKYERVVKIALPWV
jgi:hypothetical protein